MIIRQTTAIVLILIAGFTLAACSTISSRQPAVLAAPASEDAPQASPTPAAPTIVAESQDAPELQFWVEQVPRLDQQGAVVVEVTPLNLNNPGHTLDFQVSMNTHSVDLAMDLAALATLTTDTGFSVQADRWDAPTGGHHVSGKLYFPAAVDGTPLLAGATKLVLTVVNLDAAERVFIWEK